MNFSFHLGIGISRALLAVPHGTPAQTNVTKFGSSCWIRRSTDSSHARSMLVIACLTLKRLRLQSMAIESNPRAAQAALRPALPAHNSNILGLAPSSERTASPAIGGET